MKNKMHSPIKTQFEPQVRFNWGYHDGAWSARNGKPYRYTAHDSKYLAGFQVGYSAAQNGEYDENDSSPAWKEYKAETKRPSNARPKDIRC